MNQAMKVATWNVNSIRARKERLLAWLDEHKPDALCLQETKITDDAFPADEIREHGYHAIFHGQKTYNGVAILTREPVDNTTCGFGDGDPEDQARIIAGTYRGIRIVSVYVPNGKAVGTDKYHYKLEWMKRFRAYMDRCHDPNQPVIMCGDFNVAPEDRDVYNPKAWAGHVLCSDAERAALAHLVAWGFTDAFRLHHQEPGLYSWWDYRQLAFPKNLGLRIDMIYLSKPLVSRCTSAMIDRQARKGRTPSDHAPVIIELAEP